MERTLVLLKPDAVQRRIIGKILDRIEQSPDMAVVALKIVQPPHETLLAHYEEHKEKPFFPSLLEYMSSGPIVALIVAGDGVIAQMREMVGATNPIKAAKGTIRGDFGIEPTKNLIHASDSVASAEREIRLWFSEREMVLNAPQSFLSTAPSGDVQSHMTSSSSSRSIRATHTDRIPTSKLASISPTSNSLRAGSPWSTGHSKATSAPVRPPQFSNSKWRCTFCTTVNAPGSQTCDMCSSSRV